MKCPLCIEEGKTSTLREHGLSRTMLGGNFSTHDEDGKRHHHNPNRVTTNYTCSKGHGFVVKRRTPCWCGWGAKDIEVKAYVPDGSWAAIRLGSERRIDDPQVLEAMVTA